MLLQGERPKREGDLVCQFMGVAVVDGDALRSAQITLEGRRRLFRNAVAGDAQSLGKLSRRCGADDECSTQRRLDRARCRGRHGRRDWRRDFERGACRCGHGKAPAAVAVQSPRDVLLEHRMEVGTTEAEGTHPGATDAVTARDRPLRQVVIHTEGGMSEVDARIGNQGVDARRQHLLMQGKHGLEETGRSRGCLEMSDIRLHRSERDRRGGCARRAEHL